MKPALAIEWIIAGWLARRVSETARHGIRQGPPIDRIPFRDQRDVAAVITFVVQHNAASCQLLADGVGQHVIGGGETM